MKRIFVLFLIFTGIALAQVQPPSAYQPQLITYNGVPFGSCAIYQFAVNNATGAYYNCTNGAWTAVGSGSSGLTQVASLPTLPCTNNAQVNLTAGQQGLYTCIGGIWTFSPNANNLYYASAYGVTANAVFVSDASWTNGANPVAITCPNSDCNFTATQNGQECFGTGAVTSVYGVPKGTFTYVGPQSGTCSGTASGSVAGSGYFIVGTNDTAAWNAVRTAMFASTVPAGIVGPNGLSIVNSPPLLDLRTSDGGVAPWQMTFFSEGLTQFVPDPSFNYTGGTVGWIFEANVNGTPQPNMPQYASVYNLAVQGMNYNGANCPASGGAVALVRSQGANIWVWDWCLNVGSTGGIIMNSPNAVYNLESNNSGNSGIAVSSGANAMSLIINSYSGESQNYCLNVGPNAYVISKADFWLGCAAESVVVGGGAILSMDGDYALGTPSNDIVDATGTVNIYGNTYLAQTGTGAAQWTLLTRNGGKITFRDSQILHPSANAPAININTVSGGTILNYGNNTITGTDQTALASANVVLGAGWGTTASTGTFSGTPDASPSGFTFTITSGGSGQATTGDTIAITNPATTLTVPFYTCKQVGGTGTSVGVITGENTATATTMTLTWTASAAPVSGSTYIISCVGRLP